MDETGEKPRQDRPPRWLLIWTAIGLAVLFLYLVRSVLPPFVVGAAIAYILDPVVVRLEQRWQVPRALAIAALYLFLLVPLALAIVLLGPRFLEETRQLVVRTPFIVSRLIEEVFGAGPYSIFGTTTDSRQIALDVIEALRGTLGTPSEAIHLVSGVVEVALQAFLTLIVSIYLLADSERIGTMVIGLVPRDRRSQVRQISEEIHTTLARYLRRQAFLVALVATATFLGLELIFRLRYALPLAVATGFVEIVPFLGPVLAATVAALIALAQGGPGLMLGVILFYFVLRQAEDQVVMPLVLGHAVELHPLVVIFAVLAGGALFGVLGTLAAVPVAAAVKVVVSYWPKLGATTPEPPSPPPPE